MLIFFCSCYPINTALADPLVLDQKLRKMTAQQLAMIDSSDDSSSSSSSDSDDDDDSSSSESVCRIGRGKNVLWVWLCLTLLPKQDSDGSSSSSSDSDSDADANDQQPRHRKSGKSATISRAAMSQTNALIRSALTSTASTAPVASTSESSSSTSTSALPAKAAAGSSSVASPLAVGRKHSQPQQQQSPDSGLCRVCDRPQNVNRDNKPEVFVMCSTCRRRGKWFFVYPKYVIEWGQIILLFITTNLMFEHASANYVAQPSARLPHTQTAHPSCIEMPPRMSLRVQDYDWQCSECKHCSRCRHNNNEDKMLFCDQCDRGYHIYCIGLRGIPDGKCGPQICQYQVARNLSTASSTSNDAGRWHCTVCSICTVCGTRSPEGHKNPNLTAKQRQRLISTAKWSHEYRISHVSHLREHSAMLCTPCAQQRNDGTSGSSSAADVSPSASPANAAACGSASSSPMAGGAAGGFTTVLSPLPPAPVSTASGGNGGAVLLPNRT